VFSKCVTTNEGKLNQWGKEVYANSPDFEVVFNYELLDDYLDKHSSDMEDPPGQGNRYRISQVIWSSVVTVFLCSLAVLIHGAQRNSQDTTIPST